MAEQQMEALYGPAAKFSEYKRGDRVRIDGWGVYQAVILWVCAPKENAPLSYVVAPDRGFPNVIYSTDISGLV